MQFIATMLILSVLVLGTVLPALAADVIHSGTWGNLTWELNETTGHLTISGEGEMDNFESNSTEAWRAYENSIKTIVIEDGVTSIGDYAFAGCYGLESITIPNSVTSIGAYALQGGISSINVHITDLAAWCAIECGIYAPFGFQSTYDLYLNNILVSNLEIPDGVTSIGKFMFYSFKNLTSVKIPSSVTSIGDYAFFNCDSLTSVYITDLAKWCEIDFSDSYSNPLCYAESLYLNSNLVTNLSFTDVNSIGDYAFSHYNGLVSIVISDSVTDIGKGVFSGCNNLTSITVESNNPNYHADRNCLIETESKTLLSGCKNSVIPSDGSVTGIDEEAFYDCRDLTDIEIPSSITKIGKDAFHGCNSLIQEENGVLYVDKWAIDLHVAGNITLRANTVAIADHAFFLTGLTSIEIPSSVISIGDYAFSLCVNLSSITLGENSQLISIGDHAFSGCGNLASVTFGKDSQLISIGDNAFYMCSGLTSIEIPSSVTSIGGAAFAFCSGLTSIEIPSRVTSIDGAAFAFCIGLTSIEIPSNVISIGDQAFLFCSGLTSIEIPSSVTSIGDQAFTSCSGLTSIEIPSSVISIGDYAFLSCSGLTSITVDAENQKYHSEGDCLIETESKTLIVGCQNSVIPSDGSVASIGYGAFAGYSSPSIKIPSSVTNIGEFAFVESLNLTSIYYCGTEEQWNAIEKGQDWDSETGDYTIYFHEDHTYGDWEQFDEQSHQKFCDECGLTEYEDHTYASDTDTDCDVCGFIRTLNTEDPNTDEPTTDEPTTNEPNTEEPITGEQTTEAPQNDEKSTNIFFGCKSSVSLGSGLIILLSIGSAGLLLKRKEF